MSSYAPAAIAVEKSGNTKLGEISTTHASQATCPRTCPLYGAGCYAEYGYQAMTTWRLNERRWVDPEVIARQEARAIDGLSGERDLRLHVVGDCTTNGGAVEVSRAAERYRQRGGREVWTYTHAWRDVCRVCWGRVSVLANCESVADVREASRRGYATAMVVPEFESESAYEVAGGVKVIPCPAQTRGVKCVDCRLCMDDERLHAAGLTIAFEAHSQGKNKVKGRLELPMAKASDGPSRGIER